MDVVSMGGSIVVDLPIKFTNVDRITVIINQARNIIVQLLLSLYAPGLIKKVKHSAVVMRIIRKHV